MNALIKRGRFYWLDYYKDGKRKRKSLKTDRLLEAKDRAREIQDALRFKNSGPPIEDFSKMYFEWATSTKPASVERERQRWNKIAAFLKIDGILTLPTITPLVVERLRTKLIEDKLAKTTINRYLQLLRGMFYRAKDWDLFRGDNPLRKVKFFREEHKMTGLDEDQVRAVLDTARTISAKPKSKLQALLPDLIILDLNTGLRRGELLGLRWTDIKDNELHIMGKGGRSRKVSLNQDALSVIEKQPKGGQFIFDIPNRGQLGLLRRTTAAISKKVNFPFHFHLLRHTFATALLAKGVDIVTIAEILGHSRSTVSLIYAHSSPGRARQAVNLLESWTQK